MKLKDLV